MRPPSLIGGALLTPDILLLRLSSLSEGKSVGLRCLFLFISTANRASFCAANLESVVRLCLYNTVRLVYFYNELLVSFFLIGVKNVPRISLVHPVFVIVVVLLVL